MDDIVNSLNGIIPPKYLAPLTALFVISQVVGRVLQSIRTGGGLRSIIRGIWFGTNVTTPKQEAAKDEPTNNKLGLFVLIGGLVLGVSGCALFKDTTPAKAAVNVSDVSKITVEAALAAWDAYIVAHHPSLHQQRVVKAAWKDYQAAQVLLLDAALIMKEAETAGGSTPEQQAQLSYAMTETSTALADMIKLLREFGVKL